MTEQKPLHLSILVGRGAHPQAVMDDLWTRAAALADQNGYQMTGTVVYTHDDGPPVTPTDERVKVVTLAKSPAGRVTSLLSDAAGKPGPVGIAGRLARDNMESRRLAGAVARRKDLRDTLCGSDIVVAADLIADRAVWQLRKRTDADLVHGPIAMLHVLRRMVRF
jgi:hypothetical protein